MTRPTALAGLFSIALATAPSPRPDAAEEIVRRALAAAEAVTDPAGRAEAFLAIGQGQARRGENEAARETLRRAAEAAAAVPKNSRYTFPHPIIRVAGAQAEASDREGAHRTFLKAAEMVAAEDDNHQSQNWINFVPRQIETEGPEASAKTVEAYRRFVEKRGAQFGAAFVNQALIALQTRGHDFEGVLRRVREAKEAEGPNGARWKKQALIAALEGIGPGDGEAAKPLMAEARIAVELADVGDPAAIFRAQDLAAIVQALARVGRFDEAVATCRDITTGGLPAARESQARFRKAMAFDDIAEAQLKVGERKGARATARLAVEVARENPDVSRKTFPLYRAALVLARAGDTAEAARVAGDLTASPSFRRGLRVEIASAQDDAGDTDGARATLRLALRDAEEEFGRPKPIDREAQAVANVAAIQARLGDLTAALERIDALPTAEARDEALFYLAASHAHWGDPEGVTAVVGRIKDPKAQARAWVQCAGSLSRPKARAGAKP